MRPEHIIHYAILTSCVLATSAPNATFAQSSPGSEKIAQPDRSSTQSDDSRIVGHWVWTLDLGGAGGKVSMDVKRVGKSYSAILTTPDGSKIKPKEFAIKDGKIKIRIERKRGFMTFTMLHSGVMKGNAIEGQFNVSGGPVKKSGEWRATRIKKTQP